jgi:uncharacterized protein DUF1559
MQRHARDCGRSGKLWRTLTLSLLGALCLAACLVILPCVQTIRDSPGWSRSQARLKDIGVALHDYHESVGHLPPAVIRDKDGRPLYSWRVQLLPYLEYDSLYKKLKLDEPWDSPHNKPLVAETPQCYEPYLGGNDKPGLTRYLAFVGQGTAFERGGLTWDDFPDDLGETILVVEAGEAVPWAKPVDLKYDPDAPLPLLGAGYTKPVHFLCHEIRRKSGFNAVFADGKARFIPSNTPESTLRALITRNGGEKVDLSGLE